MPITTPLSGGDVPYPQYSSIIPMYIKANLQITKGCIYTADSSGRLIVPISTSGVADLSNGAFQAMATVLAGAVEDTDRVQVLVKKSRIIMKAVAGLVKGSQVELDSSGSTTTNDTVMAAVQPKTKGYLGEIMEIYTQTNGVPNKVTNSNDLVIIDTGVA